MPLSTPAFSNTPPAKDLSAGFVQTPGMVASGFHTVGTNILQVVGALVVAAIVARALGPARKGVYDLYLTATAALAAALGFSLQSGITFVIASQHVNLVKLAKHLAAFGFVQGAAAAGIAALLTFSSWGRSVLPTELGSSMPLWIGLGVLALACATLFRAVLAGQRRFITANHGDLAKQVLSVGFMAIAVAVTAVLKVNVLTTAVLAYVLATCCTAGIYLTSSGIAGQAVGAGSGLRRSLAFALPSYVGTVVQFLNYRLDVFFVMAMVGPRELGLYQLAVLLCQSINMVPGAAQAILFPTVAASMEEKTRNANRTAQATRLLVLLALFAGVSLAAVSPWVIPLVFGRDFSRSVAALWWLVPGCVAFAACNVIAGFFSGVGRSKLNVVAAVAGLLVTIPLDLLLIPRWGMVGASMASTCSYVTSSVVTVALFCRITGLSPLQVLRPTGADARLLHGMVSRVWQATAPRLVQS